MSLQSAEKVAEGAATVAQSVQALIVVISVDVAVAVVLAVAVSLGFRASHHTSWTTAMRLGGHIGDVAAIGFLLARGVRFSWIAGARQGSPSEILRTTLSCSLFAFAICVLLGSDRVEPSRSIGSQVAAFSSSVLLSPILEEMLFRGVLLRSLLSRMSRPRAIIFSAVVFSAFHPSIVGATSTFILALALGVVLLRTGSLWACVAAHSTWNLTVRLVSSQDFAQNSIAGVRDAGLANALAAILLVLGFALLTWSVLWPREQAR